MSPGNLASIVIFREACRILNRAHLNSIFYQELFGFSLKTSREPSIIFFSEVIAIIKSDVITFRCSAESRCRVAKTETVRQAEGENETA